MVSRKKKSGFFIRNNKGFSLIEIAVVLIIIGIIIGAIVKGKDIMRSAEQKKVYAKFVNGWNTAYMTFYDRTGKILGDTYNDNATGPGAGQDGEADTAEGASGDVTDAGREDLYDGPAAPGEYIGLTQVGISAPSTNMSTNYQYKYVDSAGGSHSLTVAFEYDATDKYNYMWVINCPNELGIALDTMVDSEADGETGDFLCFNLANDDATPSAWGAAAVGTEPTDEVSFRWKMQF